MAKVAEKYDAFLSYARVDDGDGDISKFHAALQQEFRQHWQREARIFMDKEISTGSRWPDVLANRLGEVRFFVAMLSPGFLGSKECRAELEAYIDAARAKPEGPRIFPIHTIDCEHFEGDEVYENLKVFQFADYRQLRFEPRSHPEFRRFVWAVAADIERSLRRPFSERPETMAELREHLEAKCAELEELKVELKGARDELEELHKKPDLSGRVKELEKLYAQAGSAAAELKSVKAELEKLRKQPDLSARIKELEAERNETISHLERELTTKDLEIHRLGSEIISLVTKPAGTEADISRLNLEISRLKLENSGLMKKVAEAAFRGRAVSPDPVPARAGIAVATPTKYAFLTYPGVALAAVLLWNGGTWGYGKASATSWNKAGLDYLHGTNGKAKSPEVAVGLFRKAVDAGNAGAMTNLGWCYETGNGVNQDQAEAFSLYTRAAEGGNPIGMCDLALDYENGRGVAKDPLSAAHWYRVAADAGNARAMAFLGNLFDAGKGVAKNATEGFKWHAKAAEGGSADGMTDLGFDYLKGRGVAKDVPAALTWWRKGAAAGNGLAMNAIGWCYGTGNGVVKDATQSFKWYSKAVEAGDPVGMFNLGVDYRTGNGVGKDPAKAVEWFRKGADAGQRMAMTSLGWCYATGFGVATDQTEATKWYRMGAEAGDPLGMYDLGAQYEKGNGVLKDKSVAKEWYTKSAALGQSEAIEALKRF